MALNLKREASTKAWLLRVALGPAQIIDGLCALVTIGTYTPGLGLMTARALSMARFAATRRVVYPVPVCEASISKADAKRVLDSVARR